jgi:universal stress protein A
MFQITRIFCPIDFSTASLKALPIAFSLARDRGASVVLFHDRPPPMVVIGEFGPIIPELSGPIEPLKSRLRELVPANHKGKIDIAIGDGDPADEILSEARRQHCDLIVMATHGRSGLGRLLLGSVAEAVLRRSPCPVLTIKPAKTESAPAVQETAPPVVDQNKLPPVCTAGNAGAGASR